ncbi:HNH endonuclease signature motif containing protein [Nocardia cyriacigeorgica]|uniref:HNH endonuclease signature motif containing protein n=1 Tax=Nocardia cyriacigeorgica TaxID=135487 RepID=UPI002458CB04|nr:HNH endonuclease signature motif containing protein [Nocardia cyriacigeorgica]
MHSTGGIGEEGTAGRLHAAVADLLDEPLTPLSDAAVIAAMREVERCSRMLTMVRHRLLVEASERSLPARNGSKSLKRFLMETLNLASADAGARVHQAHSVATFHDMGGDPVEPRLPHTAQALTAGDISADHARGIATVMNRVPCGATADDRAAAEEILTDFARTGSPDDIGKVGDKILAYLDPDGHLTTDNDRARMRGIIIGRQRPDGMSPIRGEIDPVLRALLDPLLAKYARPGMCNPDDPESPSPARRSSGMDDPTRAGRRSGNSGPARPPVSSDDSSTRSGAQPVPASSALADHAGDSGRGAACAHAPVTGVGGAGGSGHDAVPAEGAAPVSGAGIARASASCRGPLGGGESRGALTDSTPEPPDTWIDPIALAEAAERDHRSAAQRNHDALKAILDSGIVAEHLGAHRGLPVSTILTISIDDIERSAGVATTATGGTVPLEDALTLAQRSQPWLAVFDHTGLPLHLGRSKRLASAAQRLALIAALKGCSRPGCDAPASLSAVHHVLDYRKNGHTDIENLTLACDSCHALIHDGVGGWKTRVEGPRSPYAGRTAWIAPPHIDPEQKPRVNHRHHAGELLAETLSRIHLRNEQDRESHRVRSDNQQPNSTAA